MDDVLGNDSEVQQYRSGKDGHAARRTTALPLSPGVRLRSANGHRSARRSERVVKITERVGPAVTCFDFDGPGDRCDTAANGFGDGSDCEQWRVDEALRGVGSAGSQRSACQRSLAAREAAGG